MVPLDTLVESQKELFPPTTPQLIGQVLDPSPPLSCVEIGSQEHTGWGKNNLCLQCKVTSCNRFQRVRINEIVHCRWTTVNDSFTFTEACTQGFIIYLGAIVLQYCGQNTANRANLMLPNSSHVTCGWNIHFKGDPVTVLSLHLQIASLSTSKLTNWTSAAYESTERVNERCCVQSVSTLQMHRP